VRFEAAQTHSALRAPTAEDLQGQVAVGESLLDLSQGLEAVYVQSHAFEQAAL
jgi:hypothetical protein